MLDNVGRGSRTFGLNISKSGAAQNKLIFNNTLGVKNYVM